MGSVQYVGIAVDLAYHWSACVVLSHCFFFFFRVLFFSNVCSSAALSQHWGSHWRRSCVFMDL